MKTEHGRLWRGDCLELMPKIPTGKISMVFADLAYGVTNNHWDSIIPFKPFWQEIERVCSPSTAIVLTAIQPFTTAIMVSRLDWYKHQWVWNKNNAAGFASVSFKPLSTCEDVLVFSVGGKRLRTYNPQMVIRGEKRNKKGGTTKSSNYNAMPNEAPNKFNNEYYPKMLLNQFGKANGTGRERVHPTQKPLGLIEYLIRTYTNPGELVLDPTLGSGTTAIAAINTGRKFVGIEKDERIYQIAKERIEARINRVDFGIIQT